MAYTAGFSVSVGDPTKASDVTTLAANDDYLKAAVDGKAALSGSTNNTVATVTGANALIGEADLTFASNKLTVFGTTGTGAATASVLNLSTRETTVVDADQLGRIEFQAPAETGSDAVLVAASIYAEADVTFDATNNATDLVLATAHDGAAAERVRITSQGEIGLAGANYGTDGQVMTSAGPNAAVAWETIPPGTTLSGSTNNTIATVTGANALIGEANLTFDGTTLAVTGAMTLSSTSTISGDMTFVDNAKVTLGTGGDADLYYDGTNVILTPDVVGSGYVSLDGDARVTGGHLFDIGTPPSNRSSTIASGNVTINGAVDGEFVALTLRNSQSQDTGINETVKLNLSWADGGGNTAAGSAIIAGKEGTYASAATADSFLAFSTTLNNTPTERMHIGSEGHVRITQAMGYYGVSTFDGTNPGGTIGFGTITDDPNSGWVWKNMYYNGSAWTVNSSSIGSGGMKVDNNGVFVWLNQASGSGFPAETMRCAPGGNLTIQGALSKGSGSFRIRHPLESRDGYDLVHSFIEGPQADLLYRGVATLSGGTATVNIDTAARMTDGTFVALVNNVQAFTTNESGFDNVRASVSGNVLTITSEDDTSTASISWLVVGERKDAHMLDTDWTDADGRVITEPETVEEPDMSSQPAAEEAPVEESA